GQDITLRKRAEKSLALSEHRYRTLFENMNEGLLFSTETGEIVFVNNQFEKLTGYSDRELIGRNGYELLLDAEDQKQVKNKVRYRKVGLSEQYELRIRKKNGEYVWVHISASPSVDQEGKFSGIMSLVSDISGRKQTEQQLETGRLQALQYHSMLLSSQINPHFIFNALNSVQYYILDRNTEPALNFISEFSRLMRTTLQNSLHKTISISAEIEYLKLYLELERKRYSNKFDYVIEVSDNINPEDYYIPPMLLQPYIENTVVHGLGSKQGHGEVRIEFKRENDHMVCTISDDGVGRKKAMELRKLRVGNNHQSLGMSLIETRINLLRELNQAEFEVTIKDLKNKSGKAAGTQIKVVFPRITED
ncbi:MAG: PAS domain S-box protein, partial [Flavobacteriales bacterium]